MPWAPDRHERSQGAAILIVCALLLPLLDPHALEGDPFHAHIVVGGTPTDQARALASHLRHAGAPVRQDAGDAATAGCNPDHRDGDVRVLSVHGSDPAGSSIIGLGNVVATEERRVVPTVSSIRFAAALFAANPPDVIVPVPDPPPRGS